jgi:small conductance mechanosensitive channel
MESVGNQLVFFVTNYGLKIIGAILILILGRIAAGLGRRIVKRMLEKAKTEPSIVSFVHLLWPSSVQRVSPLVLLCKVRWLILLLAF